MTATVRRWLFLPFGGAIGAFLIWSFIGLPKFGGFHGSYGRLFNAIGVPERHASNVVGAIVFDFRGMDTLGEEFILFSSAVGITFLLRGTDLAERASDRMRSDAVRLLALVMVPTGVLVGLWLAAFGYVTPGGGFQGGVAVASAVVLVWIGSSFRDYRTMTPMTVIDGVEGLGASAFVLIGVVGLALSGAFMANFLGLGTSGSLASSGSIALLNWASALEVCAANLLIFREFLAEYAEALPGRHR